jgi:hypothetical protein
VATAALHVPESASLHKRQKSYFELGANTFPGNAIGKNPLCAPGSHFMATGVRFPEGPSDLREVQREFENQKKGDSKGLASFF